ncbi:MAG: cupin domain-containing protein [Myxococcales bacterium]|nr:cupin domain-containing protein [Myxococcales bacterium]
MTAAAVVDLAAAFAQIAEPWSPRIVGALNGQHVKLARLAGEFVWHDHADADELFLVVRGTLVIRLDDGDLTLGPGQLTIIPRGVRHLPVAVDEVWVLLFEPAGTVSTGAATDDPRTSTGAWLR